MHDFSQFDSADAREQRFRMVETQIVSRGITNERVLDAFRVLPRHAFCPPGISIHDAYADHPLPIGEGQTISQPFMVAEMTNLLNLSGDEKILEIGTGSGYQAAILGMLAKEVHTIERVDLLETAAQARLIELGFGNIHVHVGDGTNGWTENSPYDRIIVTAATPSTPPPLQEQLADNGILIAPVGSRDVQELVEITREGKKLRTKQHGYCCFVPLLGDYGWPER